MKNYRSLAVIVAASLLFSIASSALAGSGDRDEFPGRRQGGGTHVIR